MQIDKKKNYTLITPTETSVKEFYISFKNSFNTYNKDHIIIDFLEKFKINIEEVHLFLHIANVKRQNGTSFVIVTTEIDIDDIPDEINIVPTIVEAIDILEMEAIERDLMNF